MKEKKYENERGMIPLERYYQPEIETASREQIKAWQDERLVKQVQHVWDNVPYYRKKMEEKGVTPADIKSSDDLYKLPFLTKSDLRDAYPYGLVGMPLKDCVRIQSTSGTTGKRVVAFYTQEDIDLWEDCCARAIMAAGGTNEDVCQVSYGYGLFTGGLGAHAGGEAMGCTVIPTSSGNTKRQVQMLKDCKTDILACTPSYALLIADTAIEMGYDPATEFQISGGIFGAEPCSENMRQEIADKLGIQYCDVYGLSEIMGPGVAMECAERGGLHIAEDQFYCEIIDPETLEVLPDGEVGELVITTLTRECSPMIRYRTRDLTRILPGKCPCGRTHLRIDRIKGRSDDMFIIKGVNIFPMQVEKILVQFPELGSNYLITLETVNNQDEMIVEVELSDLSTDNYIELEKIRRDIIRQLKDEILVTPKVKLVKKGSLPQSEGKAVRVKDLRDNK